MQQSALGYKLRGVRSAVPCQAVSACLGAAFVGSLVGMAKSVCDVVDLANLTGDDGIDAGFLDVQTIEARAATWYQERVSRLGNASSLSLEQVLDRLRD